MVRAMRFILTLATVATCQGARIYYVNQPELLAGQINAVKPDGTAHATLWTSPQVTDLRGIAVDAPNARVFFAHAKQDSGTLALTEVSLRTLATGGGVPQVVAPFPDGAFISDVEWEPISNWVYVAVSSGLELRRVRPDGSVAQTVLTHAAAGQGPYFFCLDVPGQNAYWAVVTNPGETLSAYSRGSIATGVVDTSWSLVTPSRTRDIAIDNTVPGGRLYWCDRQTGAIYARAPAGGAVQTIITGLNAPHGLALDIEAGRAYVADTGKRGSGSQPSAHRVVRFKMDGTGGLEFLSPASAIAEPFDVAIDVTTTSYADWRTRFFASTALNANPGDDPDGDGLSNAAEYAFFSNPERKDAPLDALRATESGVRYARRLVSDAAVRVEVSTDLSVWHWNGDTAGAVWTIEAGTEARDADSEWVAVGPAPSLSGADKLFYRLHAALP
jgi:hypothetical protein